MPPSLLIKKIKETKIILKTFFLNIFCQFHFSKKTKKKSKKSLNPLS